MAKQTVAVTCSTHPSMSGTGLHCSERSGGRNLGSYPSSNHEKHLSSNTHRDDSSSSQAATTTTIPTTVFEHDLDTPTSVVLNYNGVCSASSIQSLATLVNIRGTMQNGWGSNVFANIRELHLANNGLTGTELSPLLQSLYYQNIHLKMLDLSFNRLCSNSVGELLWSISNKEDKQPHDIQVLKLNDNQLDDRAVEYFSWHLSSGTMPSLKRLDVSANQITPAGYKLFADAMDSHAVKDLMVTLVKANGLVTKAAAKSALKTFIEHAKAQGVDTTHVATDKGVLEYLKDGWIVALNMGWGFIKCNYKALQILTLDTTAPDLTIDYLIEKSGKTVLQVANIRACVAMEVYDAAISPEGVNLAVKAVELLGE